MLKDNDFLKKLKDPRVIYGSLYNLITILAILAVIVLNIAAKICTEKFSWNFDLTRNKIFSLTQESVDYISKIDKKIEITILNSKEKFVSGDNYYAQANSVINEYAKYNGNIEVKYIDLEGNPGFVNSYPNEKLSESNVIVKNLDNDKYKVLYTSDLLNIQQSYYGSTPTSSKAEQAMTSAILNVISEKKLKINFLSGFDEEDSSSFSRMLDTNNYEVTPVNLLNENLSSDSLVSIFHAPKRDLDIEALQKLRDYLEKPNKHLIIFLHYAQAEITNLNKFLSDWGLEVSSGFVVEKDSSKILMSGNSGSILNTLVDYADYSYTQGLKNPKIPVAMPVARYIKIIKQENKIGESNENESGEKEPEEERIKTLLQFSKSSVIMPENADKDWNAEKSEIKGPLPAMVLSKNKKEKPEDESSITLVASVTAVNSQLLSRSSLNNSAYFNNYINKITQREDNGITIEPKSMSGQELGMNEQTGMIIGVVFAIAVPILIIIIGIVVWIMRKKYN
ncbi:MAG: Gldg family protein [Candidatus Paraimprobicoccus trichonymphae]|uniref:Gldg family protein n=1 Tax=Candidatus Paraimprobicoccus trichonymphae TaxID=3033793 RepID=A0AA48HZA5_9FIRM|nr:MAG: Gldg family protein [Candidatus Paraimprobicoccus trichonymphae]